MEAVSEPMSSIIKPVIDMPGSCRFNSVNWRRVKESNHHRCRGAVFRTVCSP